MPSRTYRTSDYLTTPQDRAAYLNAALEENDLNLFFTALKNIAISENKPEQPTNPQTYQVLFQQSEREISSLNSLLRGFGLRLTVMAEKS
ncbi:putative transcriptional regulator [Gammaproteobacteria bacterium]